MGRSRGKMPATNFVVRNGAGSIEGGAVGGEGANDALYVASGNDISLDLDQSQIAAFARDRQALLSTLTDGQVIVVQGYFAADRTEQNDLFISSDGLLTKVSLPPARPAPITPPSPLWPPIRRATPPRPAARSITTLKWHPQPDHRGSAEPSVSH